MFKQIYAAYLFLIVSMASSACSDTKMQSDDRKGEADAGSEAVVAEPVSVAGAFLTCDPDVELANQKEYDADKLVVRCMVDTSEYYDDWQFFYKVDDETVQVDDTELLEEGKSSKWALAIKMSAIKQGSDLMMAAASEKAGISAEFEDPSKSNKGFQAVIDYRRIREYDEIRGLLQSSGGDVNNNVNNNLNLKKSDVTFKLGSAGEGLNYSLQPVSSFSPGLFPSELRPTSGANTYKLSVYEKGNYHYLRLKITEEGHSYCMHQAGGGNIYLFACNEFNLEEMGFKLDKIKGGYLLKRDKMCLGVDKQFAIQKEEEEKRYGFTTVSCDSDDVLSIDD